jgi:hypothetical protein
MAAGGGSVTIGAVSGGSGSGVIVVSVVVAVEVSASHGAPAVGSATVCVSVTVAVVVVAVVVVAVTGVVTVAAHSGGGCPDGAAGTVEPPSQTELSCVLANEATDAPAAAIAATASVAAANESGPPLRLPSIACEQ